MLLYDFSKILLSAFGWLALHFKIVTKRAQNDVVNKSVAMRFFRNPFLSYFTCPSFQADNTSVPFGEYKLALELVCIALHDHAVLQARDDLPFFMQ